MTRPRLLVLRALGLGDLLTSVPALRGLRRALPDHELVLATPEPLRPLVALAGAVDTLLPAHGLAPLSWSGAAPDVAVDLHGRGPQSHRVLQALSPRRLVGFASLEAAVSGPAWRADEHEVHRWTRLVEDSFGVDADPGDLLLEVPDVAPPVQGAVVVHPGAASGSRRWPPDRFAAVGRWCREQGLPVVVTGGSAELELARRVQEGAGLPADALLAGRTDLLELAALVAGAALVVSGDTGVAHLASAFEAPSVVLFGPVPPTWWGPPATGPHTVLWHGDALEREGGDPHGDDVDPALLDVGVPEVLAAVEERLQPATTGAGSSSAVNQSSVRRSPSRRAVVGSQPSC